MFGFLIADEKLLEEKELCRYKSCYCGLCRAISERHGTLPRAALSFDMTFLVILLESLYDPDTDHGKDGCLLHPFSKREWERSVYTDYAADMNVLLSYYKAMDDWNDDRNLLAKTYAKALKEPVDQISSRYKDKAARIAANLQNLHVLEQSGIPDADAAASCFGEIMRELFSVHEDHWSGTLAELAFSLGKAIYIMDACVDLEKDAARGRANPFYSRVSQTENREYFERILKMFMGEVLYLLDRLPVYEDLGIMKNILCHGIWAQFRAKYPKPDGE